MINDVTPKPAAPTRASKRARSSRLPPPTPPPTLTALLLVALTYQNPPKLPFNQGDLYTLVLWLEGSWGVLVGFSNLPLASAGQTEPGLGTESSQLDYRLLVGESGSQVRK